MPHCILQTRLECRTCNLDVRQEELSGSLQRVDSNSGLRLNCLDKVAQIKDHSGFLRKIKLKREKGDIITAYSYLEVS